MSTSASHPIVDFRCNWLRVGGLSGTLSVHLLALLLLAMPMAVPTWRPALPDPITVIIDAPPEPPVVPVPPEPTPQPIHHQRVTPVAPPVQQPQVEVDSVMSLPPMPISDPIEIPSTPTEPAAPGGSTSDDVQLAFESIVRPNYPLESRKRGEQGTVLLRVLVGRDGLPRQVDIVRSSGFRQLDRAAREALLRCRFRPVQIDGVTVQASGLVPVEFNIARG